MTGFNWFKKYSVRVGEFKWLYYISFQNGGIQLVVRYVVSVCLWIQMVYDIWYQCVWIQLVVRYMVSVWVNLIDLRYMVSVWVDSTVCMTYGVSVGGFNWLYDIWCQCGWIQLVVGYMVQCDWIQLV